VNTLLIFMAILSLAALILSPFFRYSFAFGHFFLSFLAFRPQFMAFRGVFMAFEG